MGKCEGTTIGLTQRNFDGKSEDSAKGTANGKFQEDNVAKTMGRQIRVKWEQMRK